MVSPSTQRQDIVQAQATAESYIWVHGPAAAEVCVDVCGLCVTSEGLRNHKKKLECYAEPALPFAGPASHWTLQ